MSEPLKGKKIQEECGCFHYDEDDVKSALEWMIEQHEERIELLIEKLVMWQPTSIYMDKDNQVYSYPWIFIIKQINEEYESIMILEEGLSDVI